MSKEKMNMPVIVHKASIPLLKGESIGVFTSKLSDEGKAHVFKKLNLTKDSYAWMNEAFGGSAIFSVYKQGEKDAYYAFKYTRDQSSGNFDFGELSEVERVTSYREKSADIQKSKEGGLWYDLL